MSAGRGSPDRPVSRAFAKIGLHPDTWAGLSPNGIGQQKPNHVKEMAKVAWDSRGHPKYAWNVLTRGVCDGCALGVAGLHDWTLDSIHLCTTRLKMLEFNVADEMDPLLLVDVSPLRTYTSTELRHLGRLGRPMRRRRGERGFTQISWDEALAAVGAALRDAGPDRTAWYLTSRGLTNETYYTAGKAARALGVANIDSAARVCHAPSTVGLKSTIGVAAATNSLRDVLETDLIVLWGTNPANNQPVFMKYLDKAVKRGTKVVVINPYLEPGLERYWVPSALESLVFGTKIAHLHLPVRPGGDVALANAVLQRLRARDAIDHAFVDAHTEGWDDLVAALDRQPIDELLETAGITLEQLDDFVDLYAAADSSILIWSMGITQHTDGVEGVQAIVNLALARGHVGRNGCGLMPIRGHSGVQGGAEMGAYATAFPGGVAIDEASAARLSEAWGFDVPASPGLTAPEMIDAAAAGEIDVLYSSGGNFLEVMPHADVVGAALERVPLRVHADVVLTSQMLVPGDDVILLPVRTRYEQEGGGTSTTTERRIAYSPEIPRTVGEARSEWRLYGDLAVAARPDLAPHFAWTDNRALRSEIARIVPAYAGIEHLTTTGDAIQWGGRHLCSDGEFPTASGRGRFTPLQARLSDPGHHPGTFTVATRRGKQFNSIIWAQVDPLTGAGRDAVYIDSGDAAALGLEDGAAVRLSSPDGHYDGHLFFAELPSGSLQVHWPEGNDLLPAGAGHREPRSQIPDYNAEVTITPRRAAAWPRLRAPSCRS